MLASREGIWQARGWAIGTKRLSHGLIPSVPEPTWVPAVADALLLFGALVLAVLAYFVARRVVLRLIGSVAKRSKNTWDDELTESQALRWVAQLVPGMILWSAAPLVLRDPTMAGLVRTLAEIYLIAGSLLAVNSLLNVVERIYQRFPVSRDIPIKGFIQVFKIALFVAGTIFVIGAVIGKSPALIFGSLGALTAVMMLVFKDSLLGLVAGVQLSANRMVAKGDWIEMPKFGADGTVLEVALTTVKVQNFDKTITTIPTYALISDSFRNWRGMSRSGVRRIKRNLQLDINSVRLLGADDLRRFGKIRLLRGYLKRKEAELAEWNARFPAEEGSEPVNARALTNLGTFRAYVEEYLKSHPKISNEQTLLVRQLQSTEHGLPLELYIFSTDNRWVEFEGIQSDIFDHLLAILPEFGLRAFQAPAGSEPGGSDGWSGEVS